MREEPKYDFWGRRASYRFIGRYTSPDKVEYDLYWYQNNGTPTVMARHGDFPQDFAIGSHHAHYHGGIVEAIKRVKEMELSI